MDKSETELVEGNSFYINNIDWGEEGTKKVEQTNLSYSLKTRRRNCTPKIFVSLT